MSQQYVAQISDIDRERARLRRLLRSQEAKALNRRPPNGDWSIVENVRHPLWAEQKHLGKFLPDGFEWSRVGLTQRTGKAFAEIGKEPTEDIERVFQARDAVHAPIRKAVKGGGEDVRYALERHLKHLGRHIDIIEKLLSKSSA